MLEDILSESWAFQDIMKKGWDKGLNEGWNKGREEGEQEGWNKGLNEGRDMATREELQQWCQTLYALVETRFPDLVALTKEKTRDIKQTKTLHELILQAGTAQDAAEMRLYLLAIVHEQES
ncbi:MAG TPA: hypothetical protein VHZ51_09005 [Ktedonobacteraceae bacterium]|jgi:flagellar biosynthesis/type III secretory pathway protein FliH|nr:hypothetical protein [Ktedonobacteraceae bacterium]